MKYTNYDFTGKKILITGAAGFIGSNLAFYFQDHHPEASVVAFDIFRNEERFSNGNLKSFGHYANLIGFQGEVIAGDINCSKDLELLKSYDFDYIFHQAAISDTTVADQKLMIQTNVNAYARLLEIAQSSNANMIYASSAATYGNAPSPQTVGKERPQNVYGFSKVMMDNITKKILKSNPSISVVGLRYFNVYGPREFYKQSTASMVIQLGHQILQGKAPRLFEGSSEIFRDFIYIEDVIQANIKAMHPKQSGIYNVGTSLPRSFQDIADILQKEFKTNYGTEYISNPYVGQYQFFTQADISQTIKALDYQPNYTLEKGIKAYLEDIKHHFKAL